MFKHIEDIQFRFHSVRTSLYNQVKMPTRKAMRNCGSLLAHCIRLIDSLIYKIGKTRIIYKIGITTNIKTRWEWYRDTEGFANMHVMMSSTNKALVEMMEASLIALCKKDGLTGLRNERAGGDGGLSTEARDHLGNVLFLYVVSQTCTVLHRVGG